jgi:hypothetical protein
VVANQKGDIAETAVALDLLQKGYKVCVPFGDDHRFDLLAYKDIGDFKRVQVKYCGGGTDTVIVSCASRRKNGWVKYKEGEIDWIAAFHPQTNQVFYIPGQEAVNRKEINLRLFPQKGRGGKKPKWAKDYLDI